MQNVFRKAAIERLSSPDRLDSMLKVTTPLSWVGIAAAAALAAAVIFWSLTGSIPTTVSASGFLVNSYNTNTIFSGIAGRVSQIMVEPGSALKPGDPVMRVACAGGKQATVYSDQTGIVSRLLTEPEAELVPSSELIRVSPQTDNDLSVVCYMEPGTAQQLETGMEVGIYLNSGGYGRMEGAISNIDHFACSNSAISELLGQDGQAADSITRNGPVVAVTCQLRADPDSACGYRFSGASPAAPLTGGQQATVQITLSRCAPIAKVFPTLG